MMNLPSPFQEAVLVSQMFTLLDCRIPKADRFAKTLLGEATDLAQSQRQ
jgi:hypothetical protein